MTRALDALDRTERRNAHLKSVALRMLGEQLQGVPHCGSDLIAERRLTYCFVDGLTPNVIRNPCTCHAL